MSAPERIWLQDDGEWSDDAYLNGEITWCDSPVNEADTAYLRADLVPQWRPIETAPRDGTRFLAYEATRSECRYYECWYQNDFSKWCGWQDDWDSEPEPTHWKPLDTPPEAD